MTVPSISYGALKPVEHTVEVASPGARRKSGPMRDVFADFGWVGFTSFGGTGANLALFREVLIEKGYVNAASFAEAFALANCLPGPTASQVVLGGVAAGTESPIAGVLAVLLFMLPGALVLGALGILVGSSSSSSDSGSDGGGFLTNPWVLSMQEGVGLAAISIIAKAAYELANTLVQTPLQQALFAFTCVTTVAFNEFWWVAPLTLVLSGLTGYALVPDPLTPSEQLPPPTSPPLDQPRERATALGTGGISSFLGGVLFIGPWVLLLAAIVPEFFGQPLGPVSIFYRVGCLVYGGGPVVVPLLLTQLRGILTHQQFLLGFGVVNCMPGPMFNVAAYCGGVAFGAWGAAMCWGAMVLPGTAMALGALPLWGKVRSSEAMAKALTGINAAAAGLMVAAFLELWLSLVADNPKVSSSNSSNTNSDSTSSSSGDASGSTSSSDIGANGGILMGAAHTRTAIVVALVAMQFLRKQKGPVIILLGLCLGAINGAFEVEFPWS